MKKINIWATLILLTGILSCHKENVDLIDGHTPDQRLASAIKQYKSALTSAPYGWILIETTTGKAINQGVTKEGPKASFAYFMEFNDSDRVSMYSDFNSTYAGTPNVSSFHISALQRPALVFDSYSYIHTPCDPDPTISKSPFGSGMGWGTDFEFSFADNLSPDVLGDTIRLSGNLNSASAIMVKATKAQSDAYHNGQLKATMDAFSTGILEYSKWGYMKDNLSFEMTPGLSGANSAEIAFCDAGGYIIGNEIFTVGYYFTPGSLHFTDVVGGIKSIDNINYDAGTNSITCIYNGDGSNSGRIQGNAAPLNIDPNAPKVWWTTGANNGSYYSSFSGFHESGVDDYYGFTKFSGWMYFIYWPRYGNNGIFTYDVFGTAFKGAITGGVILPSFQDASMVDTTVSQVRFTDDGRIKFIDGYPAGNWNYNAFIYTLHDLFDADGFYLILKPDGKTYDMVGAHDGRTWMRWNPSW